MKIKIYKDGELIDVVEVESIKEYQEFVDKEFKWLLQEGYQIECEGSV